MLRKVTVLRSLAFKPLIRQQVQRFCGISNSLKLEFYLRNWDDLYEHRHTKKLEQALKSAISSPSKVLEYSEVEDILSHEVKELMSVDEVITIFLHLQNIYDLEMSSTTDIFSVPAEFRHELMTHECYPMLIENVESHLPHLTPKVASALYAALGRIGVPLVSPLMQKLCIKLKNSLMTMDPQDICHFAVGLSYINPLLDGKVFVSKGLNHTQTHMCLLPFNWRIEEFVAKAETVEDIEFIALCCSFVPHTLDDKKLHGFLSKVSEFIDSGLLNPRKASNAEELEDILSCLVRIASLNLRKKSHFLKHCDNLVKVMNQFEGYVDQMPMMEKMILAKVMGRTLMPATVLNEMIRVLRQDLKLKNDPDLPVLDILSFFAKLNILRNEDIQLYYHYIGTKPNDELLENTADILMISKRLKSERYNLDFLTDGISDDVSTLTTAAIRSSKYGNFLPIFPEDYIEATITSAYSHTPIININRFVESIIFLSKSPGTKVQIPQELEDRCIKILGNANPRTLSRFCISLDWFSSGEKNFKVQVELCRRFFQLVEDPGTSQNMVHVLKLLWAFLKLLPFFSQAEVDNIMASDFGKALIEGQNSPEFMRGYLLAQSIIKSNYEVTPVLTKMFEKLTEETNVHSSFLFRAMVIYKQFRPELPEQVLDKLMTMLSQALLRDFETSSYQNIFGGCELLAMYQKLPPELAVKVFNNDFLQQFDAFCREADEVEVNKVKSSLCTLNRVVCAFYPQWNIPWFHEEFSKSHISNTKSFKIDPDLVNTMIDICGGNPDCVRANVRSPLWSKMHFELVFDKDKQVFVPITDEEEPFDSFKPSNIKTSPKNFEHVAIFNIPESGYSTNTKKLNHVVYRDFMCLAKEGFTVICVEPWEWNKMCMSSGNARMEYFTRLLNDKGIHPKSPLVKKSITNGSKY